MSDELDMTQDEYNKKRQEIYHETQDRLLGLFSQISELHDQTKVVLDKNEVDVRELNKEATALGLNLNEWRETQ